MSEAKWSREELIEFILNCLMELDGVTPESREKLEEMTWEELDFEADWLYGLLLK